MRVLLINPPVDNIIKTELPEFIRSDAGIFPPLGLMYIASYLKKYNPDAEIHILDAVAERMSHERIGHFVSNFLPDVVGITAHTHNLIDINLLVASIKNINHKIHMTLGGPHVNIFPKESVGINGVDSVVLGEGEITFSELVDCLLNKGDLNKVSGILFKNDKNIIYTCSRMTEKNLNRYPWPDRELLDIHKYNYALSETSGKITTMISARGCPYNCTFCSTPKGDYRLRTPEDIADEIETCLGMNINEIHFIDDTFCIDRKHVLAVCNEIKKRHLNIKWGIRARIDNLDKDLLYMLEEGGCNRINLGVETSTDEGLRLLGKRITVGQIREIFRWLKETNITTTAYFMLGCPHEKTKCDTQKTIDFAIELNPDYAMFNILTLYPGTELYKEAIRRSIIKGDCWREFAIEPKNEFLMPFWTEWISRQDLLVLLIKAYRKFYMRQKFIYRSLKDMNSLREGIKYVKTGIRILIGS